jgi:hypothetical protein
MVSRWLQKRTSRGESFWQIKSTHIGGSPCSGTVSVGATNLAREGAHWPHPVTRGSRIIPHLRSHGTTRFLSSDTVPNGQQPVLAVNVISLMAIVVARSYSQTMFFKVGTCRYP